MTIAEIIRRKGRHVVTVECDTPVSEAVSRLAVNRIGALPVLKNGKVVGIVSERDVVSCLDRDGGSVLSLTMEKVMSSPAMTVTEDVPVLAALSKMSSRKMRHLPVVRSDELVGIVSIGDLVAYRIAMIESEVEAMRSYIQGS